MFNKNDVLRLVEATYHLVQEAEGDEALEMLADLALHVSEVSDLAANSGSDIRPDLGTNLVEFAQLKRDGFLVQAAKFEKSLQDELGAEHPKA